MKKAILFRLGGLGDILILTCVAKELKKRGYSVDAALGSPTGDPQKILGNLGVFDKIIKYDRYPVNGLDVVRVEDSKDDWVSYQIIKSGYDLVVDYKFSIELNSHYKHMVNGPGKEWFVSQNSNYVNWMDVMFGWAGIDPESVDPKDKIPLYKMEPEEDAWAKKLLRQGRKVVAIQTNASSLVRTWYHPQRLPEILSDEYGRGMLDFVVFDGARWQHLKGKYVFPIKVPEGMDPIRASAAIVGNSDVFIGADSGFSHVAEALGVKSVTIYTTVPAWTRMKYYVNSIAVEPVGDTFNNVKCRPCFVLDRYCPRVREAAVTQLSDRERELKGLVETNVPPEQAARQLNTTPQGIMGEAQLLRQRLDTLIEQQAPCTMTITPERILAAVKGVL